MTDKQIKFCCEYIIDWNATRAALAAGYKENTACQTGYENLKKPYIQEYISDIQKDVEKQAGISVLSQVMELKKIAYSNIADIFDGWTDLKNLDSLTKEQKGAILEINFKKDVKEVDGVKTDIETEFVKLKMHDKLKAIQEINKILGYNSPEKIEHEITTNTPDFSKLTYEQIAELARDNKTSG